VNKGGPFFSYKKEITLNLLMLGGGGDLTNCSVHLSVRMPGFHPGKRGSTPLPSTN